MESGLVSSGGKIFTMTAAQVQAADASTAGSFCIAKFSADFKSLAGSVRVSDGDVRHRDVVGDAWIAPVSSAIGARTRAVRSDRAAIQVRGGCLSVDRPSTAMICDVRGRTLRVASTKDGSAIDLRTDESGAAVVTVRDSRGQTSRLLVQR